MGDVHAVQGDLEFSGSADEIRAQVTLKCDVIRNKQIPAPRIETKEKLVALCHDKPLDLALERACNYLMDWLISDFGFTHREAYLQICLNPDFRVNVYQLVRGLGVQCVGAELPKKYIDQ